MALAVLVIAAVGSLVALRLRQPAATVYTAEADSYVSKAHPSTSYGSAVALRTDATPRIYSYLRFRLDGRSGRVVRARLRLWSSTGSLAGYSVHPVPTTSWDEQTIAFTRHPAAGAAVAKSGPFSPGSWSSVDVTRLVKGRDKVSLVVTTRSTQTIAFDSREGSHRPQLVVQTRPGSAPLAATSAAPGQ
ncbi:MAG TPA: DNRLRE domain-containing protein [Actinomycetes bacterium]